MEPHHLDDARATLRESDERYVELFRTGSMSVGLYVLPSGGTDEQEPHTEDEVYHVLTGHGAIEFDDDRHPVGPGDVVFVGRGVDHRFVDLETDFETLVVFAPPEGTGDV